MASSCATLDAPGIAVTAGLRIAHASATCAAVASWAAATSRMTAKSPAARSALTGRKRALNDLTGFFGRLPAS